MTDEEKAAAAKAEAEKAAAEKEAADKAAAEKAEAEKAAAEKEEADKKAAEEKAEADKNKSEDQKKLEALQAEIAEKEAALKAFEGIDPEVAKANAKKLADAEKAAKDAEKAKAKAEGDFAKLAELQQAEREAEMKTLADERDAANAKAEAAQRAADKAAISVAFSNSQFLVDETILTPSKAEKLYGDLVEFEDGGIVVYDSPAGVDGRSRLMDTKGKSLSFNEAIAKVISADPDKDTLLKTKAKPGAETSTHKGKAEQQQADRMTRLAEGIKSLRNQ